MKTNPTTFLVLATIALVIVLALRANHWYDQYRNEGHDDYEIMARDVTECPPVHMFGFKLSALLAVTVFNSILVIYLILRSR